MLRALWLILLAGAFWLSPLGAVDGVITAATFLGGNRARGDRVVVAADRAGNVYVGGTIWMDRRPKAQRELILSTANFYPASYVMKLDAALSSIVYAVYFAGGEIRGIAADGEANAYVTGVARTSLFPAKNSLYPQSRATAFVMKINPSGSDVVYATTVGGSQSDLQGGLRDEGNAIAVDGGGNVYVAGTTTSQDFPVVQAVQGKNASPPVGCGPWSCSKYFSDAFVFKLNAAGTALLYSTYLGGNGDDEAYGLAVDSAGDAFVGGTTTSSNYPITAGARNSPCTPIPELNQPCVHDAFITKIDASGSRLAYSARFGSVYGADQVFAVTVDAAGNAYVGGKYWGGIVDRDFANRQLAPPNYASELGRAFAVKLNPAGTALAYALETGGSTASGIAVDSAGAAYVGGSLRTLEWYFNRDEEFDDAYVARISPGGDAMDHRVMGYGGFDGVSGLALGPSGAVYVAGNTASPEFPATPGSAKSSFTAPYPQTEDFVARVNPAASPELRAEGVVSAASYEGGAVAPGEAVVLFGDHFGPPALMTAQLDANRRLRTRLGGTRVLFDGIPAPLLYAAPNQVSAIAPFALGLRPETLTQTLISIEHMGQMTIGLAALPVTPLQPALFTRPGTDLPRRASAFNEDGTVNTPENPARRGSIITVFGTGFGLTKPPSLDGEVYGDAAPAPVTPPAVYIGGAPAGILYAAGAPGLAAGLIQINVRVPAAAVPGAAVPVVVSAGPATGSGPVIAVQ